MNEINLPYIGVKLNPGVLNGVDQAIQNVSLDATLESPRFRIADVALSYRLISNLKQNDLLPTTARESERSWSKFSIKDYVYLLCVTELRSFGASTGQLRGLRDIFYEQHTSRDAVRALCAVFGRIEIALMMYADGKIYLCDADNAALMEASIRPLDSFIKVSINKHLNYALKLAGIPYQFTSLETMAERHMRLDLEAITLPESKALEMIRNNDYRKVVISKKKDGALNSAEGRREIDGAMLGKTEMMSLLAELDFGQVEITKRDGRIVHVVREDSVKL